MEAVDQLLIIISLADCADGKSVRSFPLIDNYGHINSVYLTFSACLPNIKEGIFKCCRLLKIW